MHCLQKNTGETVLVLCKKTNQNFYCDISVIYEMLPKLSSFSKFRMYGGRLGLYGFLIIVLLIILNVCSETTYFQWLTLLVILVLILVFDLVFFQTTRAFIFDPFYANYQKLTKVKDY